MKDLDEIMRELVARVPRAIGAIVCDWEGEAIACAVGNAPMPPGAKERAKEHVPKALDLTMPVSEFLVRLAGAEPAGILRMLSTTGTKLGTGLVSSLSFSYREVAICVSRLPNDFYLMVLLRRPAITGTAFHQMHEASRWLAEHVS